MLEITDELRCAACNVARIAFSKVLPHQVPKKNQESLRDLVPSTRFKLKLILDDTCICLLENLCSNRVSALPANRPVALVRSIAPHGHARPLPWWLPQANALQLLPKQHTWHWSYNVFFSNIQLRKRKSGLGSEDWSRFRSESAWAARPLASCTNSAHSSASTNSFKVSQWTN